MSNTKTYTISEDKFVKLVILSICDNVDDGFAEFENLEGNEQFIKQIVGQIYARGTENTLKILNLVGLVPEIDKKYSLIAALYDEIMLIKDVTSASLIFEALHALSSSDLFTELDANSQKNTEVMRKVLEIIIAYGQQNTTETSGPALPTLPPLFVNQQNVLTEIQENMNKMQENKNKMQKNMNKMQEQIAELEEMKVKFDIDKMIMALNYVTSQLDAIQKEKSKIDEWKRNLPQLLLYPNEKFENIFNMAVEIKEMENFVFTDNRKLMIALKDQIPYDIKLIAWMEGVYLKNSSYLSMSIDTNHLIGYDNKSDASRWIFEISGKGVFLKNLTTQAYIYATYEKEFKALPQKQNSDHFCWTLKRLGANKYDIINNGTEQSMNLVYYSTNKYVLNSATSSEWIIEK